MKIHLLTVYIAIIICLSGCRENISYDLRTRNQSNEKLYECTIIEFEKYIPSWSATNPGTGGSAGPATVPVPDKLTITWKTVRLGKEKEAESHEKKIDMLLDDYFKKSEMDASFPYPKYVSFPQDLYEDHKVDIILKDKVPKRPKNGEIIITYMGNENFDVQYIEKKQE